jgi:hypothetical protein
MRNRNVVYNMLCPYCIHSLAVLFMTYIPNPASRENPINLNIITVIAIQLSGLLKPVYPRPSPPFPCLSTSHRVQRGYAVQVLPATLWSMATQIALLRPQWQEPGHRVFGLFFGPQTLLF